MGKSSSGSWRAGVATDIIDLDKFIRAGVRPSDAISTEDELCYTERLLVDAGAGRKPVRAALHASGGESSRVHHKRYSHDSGLSGDSYTRPPRRLRRRLSVVHDTGRTSRDTLSDRNVNNSSNSVQAFRKVCERTLLDQQRQITRIAQLCERLTEQRTEPRVARAAQQSATQDSSEISSSSRSTKDQRRKDKHRTDECKTYKIIMNKLDELNRLFVSRGRSPPARSVPPPRAIRHSTSCSLSVHENPVSSRVLTRRTTTLSPQAQVLVERAVGDGSQRRGLARTVTQACTLDIFPTGAFSGNQNTTPNVTMVSLVNRGSSCSGSGRCGSRSHFHQEDQLYAHHSLERTALLGERHDKRRAERLTERSLCALCRGCWRSVRQYIAAQIFCRPTNYL